MSLISKALDSVDNAEVLLKIKGVIALFIQTMDVREPITCYCILLIRVKTWGYQVSALDNFLLKLFEKYSDLLKRRFGDDFQEVSTRY